MKKLKTIGEVGRVKKVKQKQTNSIYVKGKNNHLPGYVDMGRVEKEVENPSPLLGRLQAIKTPNQEYNEKSAYARYRKATREVFLSKIVNTEQENNPLTTYKTFWFPSNNSPDGYWNVVMTSRMYYLRVKKKTLFLFGEVNYQLIEWIEEIQEDGHIQLFNTEEDDEFKWEQIEGIRTVYLNGQSNTVITGIPSLYIPGSGEAITPVERATPIVLRIYPPDEEYLFDELVIWTTPTSFVEGLSLNSGYQDDRNIAQYWFYPFSEEDDYSYGNYYSWTDDLDEPILVTWHISPSLNENLVSIHWLINVIGTKTIYAVYIPSEPRLIWVDRQTHYYPLMTWDWWGDRESHESIPLYIPPGRIDFAHDFVSQKHLYLYRQTINSLVEVLLLFKRLIEEDICTEFSLPFSISSLIENNIYFSSLTVSENLYIRRTRSLVSGQIRTLISGEERILVEPLGGTHTFSLSLNINIWEELGVDFGIIG